MNLITIPSPEGFRIRDQWMLPLRQAPCAYISRNRANNVRNRLQRIINRRINRTK